ncbi:shikimate dehydrogenase [Salinibacillus xinjiangensis]|uniref:Shikimate dehydrogenase (NADP(+)) n=1 Tax=Salinibacillus xinjiangensis TaxID=1229268 RepID=A0A6G1X6Y3_9BACI|nr:shikimate dehydrogenase [Salinibacillus xinjiangensis]MRG86666.1 shikimate dehydrogenase [Salinibacillus xinjiangensis]
MGYELGVIGNPIKHSLSPWIHGQFMEMAEVEGRYLPYEIQEEQLEERISEFKLMKMDGFNVTIPYKEKIMELIDEVEESAKSIGAVNTVVYKNGKLIGYNTDGKGYISSLKNSYPDLFDQTGDKKVLMIGAGGAARGIYDALNREGFTMIDIANRTLERAEKIRSIKQPDVDTTILSLQKAEENISKYDLIVQTTNIGMTPDVGLMPIELQNIRNNTVISDIIYNPIETKFLQTAKKKGARIHYGHGMLLYQAALAFELWTGQKVDPSNLLERLEQKLKGGS